MRKIGEVAWMYASDNSELLEIIPQYNDLVDEIARLNDRLKEIKFTVLESNRLYEEFKKDFAQAIAEGDWGEKVFYAIPIYEDYDSNDPWITLLCDSLRDAVSEENRKDVKNYMTRNFYNSVFSLPKDIYYYKLRPHVANTIVKDLRKLLFTFSAKMWMFFKYVKDHADSLRGTLLKSNLFEPLPVKCQKISFITVAEYEKDKMTIESSGDPELEFYKKYSVYQREIDEQVKSPEEFIAGAKNLYQKVLAYRNELDSFEKLVYKTSLMDIYKLYDSVKKSYDDFDNAKQTLADAEEASIKYCIDFQFKVKQMIEVIEKYLANAFYIKPLQINVGDNFNLYDVHWYDVLVAEDSPSEELVECISSVSDMGFARFYGNKEIEFVTRTAKISVYNKKVITVKDTDNDNE